MKKIPVMLFFFLILLRAIAQETFPVNGVQDERPQVYAFTNGTIYIDHENMITNGTLVIKKGVVNGVGIAPEIPKNAIIYDLKGKYIYPSFIELYSDYGIPKKKEEKKEKKGKSVQMLSKKKGAYSWNQAIIPEFDAYRSFTIEKEKSKEYREIGYGAVLSHRQDGISRGSGVFVFLSDEKENKTIIKDKAANHFSFNKGSSKQNYPGSLMGTIALLRQTYLDAQWYNKTNGKIEYNISLEAWNNLTTIPQIFETDDKLSILRADRIGDEFGVQYIFKGNGDEYQRLDEIKATGGQLIIPINFPIPYDVEDPYDAMQVPLNELKHWEMAPFNCSMLEKKGVSFAITTSGLKQKKDFWKNLRKAIHCGLSESTALKALTITPARMLGMQDKIGTLEKGKIANFLITSGNIFNEDNVIFENWVNGCPYLVNEPGIYDIMGGYKLDIESVGTYSLFLEGTALKPTMYVKKEDTVKIKVSAKITDKLITLNFQLDKDNKESKIRLSGLIEGNILQGKGRLPGGEWVDWKATFLNAVKPKEKKKKDPPVKMGDVIYPFVSYGWVTPPEVEQVLIKNATVWTNEKEGVLKNTDVLIIDGKINKIGQGLTFTGGREIDATGKYLTSGIIDEHTHIAISRGVNEGTQVSSAEVRVGDVINPEDINIYRALSGGVTAVQLLHGSANPIGGQSGIIKLRWGFGPEKMKIKNADPFIKFALGENVKQSNWGDHQTIRFPQTRMGVEQVFFDYFTRAKEYENARNNYHSLSKKDRINKVPVRKDLELDALVDILHHKLFITCHSYVQSEINMLIHVADSMGFKVNTFTHILEGYKVADKIKQHGAGASSFSDWWAYKYEVIDAIPYNAALMNEVGLVTAINSDDAEMGRRLNQEAAKTIKYGNVSREDAWKMVTLNPAKLLHLDHKMGSIAVGKDADIVLWSDDPLSVYAKVEKTYVDGRCFFDAARDKEMREVIKKERMAIIQRMILAKKKGTPVKKPDVKQPKIYKCNDIDGS